VFHHVRTVTLNNVQLVEPQVMVGCSRVRRLFVLDGTDGGPGPKSIYRIDPFSGNMDLQWMVDSNSVALNVTHNDQLLVTMSDAIKQYTTDGRLLCDVGTDDLTDDFDLHECFMLPESDDSGMVTCSSA